ncbi:RagB/SusD family nutrient uptake outer membrane protein [Sinomicrobium soli]|uniref:RagB/SusD family nutrient uptake outer membrane protein n=1 Tax=Sinomicrobium sp. N-1-3-6 TaxID=2219864 RepID=UPI000DCC9BED|nr:RagB/SusD family nutrient uptake outer membrane protein [Sinomicrobium sp. N-1-3-6]RAV28623.1 RagB/SusD family nutrient uptake outer membrane protein [Sinomicrobium sp. N-1-3-6]
MKKILFTVLVIVLYGCSKLDIEPDGVNTSDNLFKSAKDAQATVNAIYAALQTHDVYNQFMEVVQSQGTDDAEWGYGRNTSNGDKLQMDKFQFDASSGLVYRFWENHYKNINRANIVIKNIPGMELDEEVKNRFLGEARFLRALMYFNMVRLFGKVPLLTSPTEVLENLDVARSEVEEVYDQIEADLQFGKEHLPSQYSPSDYGRPTRGAAMSLLAKVYLTRKDYQKAAAEARSVMDLKIYSLWPEYEEVFDIANENTGESIFEIQFTNTQGTSSTVSSSYQGFFKPPSSVLPPGPEGFAGYGDNPVTENHYLSYAPGDKRREVNVLYIPTAPSSIQYPYYVNKYHDPNAITVEDGGNNYYILRYADILLMYAEAENELSAGSPQAYEAFNQVRRRAFGYPVQAPSPADLTTGLSQEQFRDSIMLERRHEFAFEGQRRFDLLRWGKLLEAMNAQDPTIDIQDRYVLFPIPTDELLLNDLLDQNEGY